MESNQRRLYRSRHDKVLAGVCGGLGEYLNIDPVLLRVGWVALVLIGGFGVLLYIFWIFLVPLKPGIISGPPTSRSPRTGMGGIIFGSLLVFLGFLFLADEWYWIDLDRWWDFSWRYIGPVMLILIGGWFLFRSRSAADLPETGQSQPDPSEQTGDQSGRRLRKSRSDKKLFGVCGGIGEYTDVDPTVIRLLFVALTLASPPVGILTYIALAIFTPAAETNHMHARAGA